MSLNIAPAVHRARLVQAREDLSRAAVRAGLKVERVERVRWHELHWQPPTQDFRSIDHSGRAAIFFVALLSRA